MRLHPSLTAAEVYVWLKSEAMARWLDTSPALDSALKVLAEDMALISAVDLPDELEPN